MLNENENTTARAFNFIGMQAHEEVIEKKFKTFDFKYICT